MKDTKEDFNNLIGKRLMKIRNQKKITREQLAESADISAKYLYEIEMGRKNCSLYIIYKISRSLEINVDFIIQEELVDKPSDLEEMYYNLKCDQKKQLKEVMKMICEIIDNIK